ncbi:MAG: AAA family ATPase [Anaerolineae bacterium]|nr:AAA family ATPase [Anaerolineae bacterium]
MLTKIEALNYRALRHISQTLRPFQVLVGPNASGKSTFLDVIAFVADLINKPTLADAVYARANDIRDLTWNHSSEWLELAIEVDIPPSILSRPQLTQYRRLRYEVRIGVQEDGSEVAILAETLWLAPSSSVPPANHAQPRLFPSEPSVPPRITAEPDRRMPAGWRKVVNKIERSGNDYFRAETTEWNNMFRLGPRRSALANLPEDESRFPAATWFKRYISEGVQRIVLNSEAMRRPSPPHSPRSFLPDGSNLPWVIDDLKQKHPKRLSLWVEHLRTALPDVRSIDTVERPEDRHRYLVLEYETGLRVPSWLVSDGTLRMMALTILAYLPDVKGIYLIEEPENGIHPRAVEAVFQSLSSVYDAQVLLATHSPVILSLTKPEQLLCFARTPAGETDIVPGDEHPRLADWRGEVSLSTLYASGVLG